jgi:prepilin-type N-terminal cleavage/methylation domain-containing protein
LKKTHRAFTLIEIMIVVLIIGILLGIAVPNFVRSRESARAKACVANLKQIDSAKQQWAMDNRAAAGGTVTGDMATLVGTTGYIKSTPVCPSSGTYTLGTIEVNPICSIGGEPDDPLAHVLPEIGGLGPRG